MNVAVKSSVESGADRRAFGRRETHMPASVRLPNHTLYDCIIRDISEGGALLEFSAPDAISGRLRLSFDGGNQEIICDVRHVRGNRVGVEFARNITLAARPIAAPDAASAPLPSQRPAEFGLDVGRTSAASELVALRRNAAKHGAAMPEAMTGSQPTPMVVEIPVAVEPSLPRDISSLLQSVANLAAERAVPRPLPARAYATVLVIEIEVPQFEVLQGTVPRDISSLLRSVAAQVAAQVTAQAAVKAVPRPLPAGAFATALVIEPVLVSEETVPRNMSSLLDSVAALVAVRSVPRPLPARAYA